MTGPSSNQIVLIDDVVRRFFAGFDNRNGRVPRISYFDSLFATPSVIASHSGSVPVICTVDEFARPRVELLSSGRLVNFSEWETEAETQVIGSLAVRRSRYSKSGRLDGRPYEGTGTKFFQLAHFDGNWRIVALSWADDVTMP